MKRDGILSLYLNKFSIFSKKYTVISLLIVAILFITVVLMVSLYANVLLNDYPAAGGAVTGIGRSGLSLTKTLLHYDSYWYLKISQSGYKSPNEYAFLPLYPLTIRLFKNITSLSYLWSAIVLSWVTLCATSVVLFKWFELEIKRLNKKISPWIPLGLLAIFPTSMYLAVPYSDCLFMLLNVSALYFYRKDNYWLAAIFAALSSATRYQGVLLFVFFGVDLYLSKVKNYKKLIPTFAAFLGIFSYMLFLKIHTGSALEFIKAENQWGRLHGNILVNLIKSFRPIELWFVLVAIIGLRYMWKYLDKALFIYSLVFILEPVSTGTFSGLTRYMLNLTPLFLVFGILGSKEELRPERLIYIMSSVLLLGWYVIFIANNYLVG